MLRRTLALLLVTALLVAGCSPEAPTVVAPGGATLAVPPATMTPEPPASMAPASSSSTTALPPTLAPERATVAPPQANEVPSATLAPPSAMSVASVTPTAIPRNTRAIPTGLAPSQVEKLNSLQRGYVAMVLLESTMTMLEEVAAKVQANEIEEAQGQGFLLGIGAILNALEEMVAQPVPDTKLGAAWADVQEAHRLTKQALTEWTEAKVTPAEVPERLDAARQTLGDALTQAEQTMSQEYGITAEQFNQWREETVAQLAAFRMQFGSTPTSTS